MVARETPPPRPLLLSPCLWPRCSLLCSLRNVAPRSAAAQRAQRRTSTARRWVGRRPERGHDGGAVAGPALPRRLLRSDTAAQCSALGWLLQRHQPTTTKAALGASRPERETFVQVSALSPPCRGSFHKDAGHVVAAAQSVAVCGGCRVGGDRSTTAVSNPGNRRCQCSKMPSAVARAAVLSSKDLAAALAGRDGRRHGDCSNA